MKWQVHRFRQYAVLVAMMGVGTFSVWFADQMVRNYFPVRPILDDLFFRITPYIPEFSYVADGVIVVSILLYLFLIKIDQTKLQTAMATAAFLYFLRGLLNLVTPIGDPSGDAEVYGFLEAYPLMGMFPSGHIGFLVGQYLLLHKWNYPKKWLAVYILLIVLESFALWVTRGHYTIDIVGGMMVAYFAVKYGTRLMQQPFFQRG